MISSQLSHKHTGSERLCDSDARPGGSMDAQARAHCPSVCVQRGCDFSASTSATSFLYTAASNGTQKEAFCFV